MSVSSLFPPKTFSGSHRITHVFHLSQQGRWCFCCCTDLTNNNNSNTNNTNSTNNTKMALKTFAVEKMFSFKKMANDNNLQKETD